MRGVAWVMQSLLPSALRPTFAVALVGSLATFVTPRALSTPVQPPLPPKVDFDIKKTTTAEKAPNEGGQKEQGGSNEQPGDSQALATLVHAHTGERLVLTAKEPSPARLSRWLADRTNLEEVTFDTKLLALIRALVKNYPLARIEVVSGYRSAKMNEQLRKKGHHVASHSQHSLGHAIDFRIIPEGASKGLPPKQMAKEIRALGWEGGVGTYSSDTDWFVHADVGRKRRWGS
jgi:uncharacterized protein YcbK (DUF882 family)